MPTPTLKEDWHFRLAALQSGWDNDGAKAISHEALSTLGDFSVVPCVNGGLQVEIHRDGIDLEIEIGPDGTIGSVLVAPAKA